MDNNTDTIHNEVQKKSKHHLLSSSSSTITTLTTYKKVVDIHHNPIIHYGLTQNDYTQIEEKIRRQKCFLNSTFIHDKISNIYIPLANITMSANHNSNRYYAEIQNRINTLVNEANSKSLVPLFLTITLPSEYHIKKLDKKTKKLIPNPMYNHINPRECVKELTRMFSKIRHDRSLKELTKEERIYYRVNEPHKEGTPHTHILLFIPKSSVERVVNAFKRLYFQKSNKIETDIKNSSAYIMKYINKTLPLSKQENLTDKEKYLNAWYSRYRITRFNSSRTLAPLKLYRLLHERYSLKELTTKVKHKTLNIFVLATDLQKIMEVFDGDELVYRRSENFKITNL